MMENAALKDRILTDLTDDAKAVGCSFFPTVDSHVTFRMEKSRPSEQCQVALDELVAKGFASVEPFNRFGGVVYKPKVSFQQLAWWAWQRAQSGISIKLYEPISKP